MGDPYIELDADDLPLDRPVRRPGGDAGIVIIRTDRGVFAYEDRCPHAGWRLSSGDVRDGRLECPGHGWEFAVDTGACTDVPGYALCPLRVLSAGARVRVECPATDMKTGIETGKAREEEIAEEDAAKIKR